MQHQQFLTDKEIIEKTIRANLNLIKAINRNPEHGLKFDKDLLIRGNDVLSQKTSLTPLERSNMLRFINEYGAPE